jgi:hypothetical protein
MSNDQISKPFWSLGFGNWDSVELLGQSQIEGSASRPSFAPSYHFSVVKVMLADSRQPIADWIAAGSLLLVIYDMGL